MVITMTQDGCEKSQLTFTYCLFCAKQFPPISHVLTPMISTKILSSWYKCLPFTVEENDAREIHSVTLTKQPSLSCRDRLEISLVLKNTLSTWDDMGKHWVHSRSMKLLFPSPYIFQNQALVIFRWSIVYKIHWNATSDIYHMKTLAIYKAACTYRFYYYQGSLLERYLILEWWVTCRKLGYLATNPFIYK